MAKKRRNSGHTGSSKGREDTVHCYHCNRLVSRSKAKRVTRRLKYIEPAIAKELKKSGTVLFDDFQTEWLCISCAIHSHRVKIRAKDERHNRERL